MVIKRGGLVRHPFHGGSFVGRAIVQRGNTVVVSRWPDGRRYPIKTHEAEIVETCGCCDGTGHRRV